jgi:hypothetical protein
MNNWRNRWDSGPQSLSILGTWYSFRGTDGIRTHNRLIDNQVHNRCAAIPNLELLLILVVARTTAPEGSVTIRNELREYSENNSRTVRFLPTTGVLRNMYDFESR